MSRRGFRQASATGASVATTADDEDSEDDVQRLEVDRARNDQKLKSRFEHIFRKYEHDFTGVGDEIDIESGEIVVNNGHLQHMRNEVDPGKSATSRFVKTWQHELEYEDETTSSEDDDDDDDDSEDSGESDSELEPEPAPSRTLLPHRGQKDSTHGNAFQSFNRMSRPAPRLAQLLVNEGTTQRPIDLDTEDSVPDVSREGTVDSFATPVSALCRVPALKQALSTLTSGSARRQSVGNDTIQALGTTIANQLAQLVARPPKENKKKRKTKTSRKTSRRGTQYSVWDFPELRHHRREKRKRSPSPIRELQPSSPNFRSPSHDSLWADEDFSTLRRRKRQNVFADSVEPPVRRFGSQANTPVSKRCWNCSLTRSPYWEKGPHGQDLCSSCSQYYERHGRMKPFDSPTPSLEDEEFTDLQSDAPVFDDDVAYGQPVAASGQETELRLTEEPLQIGPPQLVGDGQRHDHQEHSSERSEEEPEIETPEIEVPEIEALEIEAPEIEAPEIEAPEAPEIEAPEIGAPEIANAPVFTTPEPQTDGLVLANATTTYAANTSRPIESTPNWKKGSKWSTEDDALIIKLKEHDKLRWDAISRQIPSRSIFSLQNRYSSTLHDRPSAGRDLFHKWIEQVEAATATTPPAGLWKSDEDELLLELRKDQKLGWADIATFFTGRTSDDVQRRYDILSNDGQPQSLGLEAWARLYQQGATNPQVDAHQRKHTKFTPAEDALLVRLREVDRLSWHEISVRYPDRACSSLQKRYSSSLAPNKRMAVPSPADQGIVGSMEDRITTVDPELASLSTGNIKYEPFTPEDDELIRTLAEDQRLGWEDVAANFPGRPARLIMNRYKWRIMGQGQPITPSAVPATSAASNDEAPAPASVPPPQEPGAKVSAGPGSRHAFTKSEDDIILHLKERESQSWEEIARELPGRSAKAIAERYTIAIRPRATVALDATTNRSTRATTPTRPKSLPDGNTAQSLGSTWREYTAEEDARLVRLRSQGVSWTQMAHHFPGRASASLQSYWRSKYGRSPARSRQSLPSTLPSASHSSANPLLRRALDNSLRRRSDIATSTSSNAPSQPSLQDTSNRCTTNTAMLDPALQTAAQSGGKGVTITNDIAIGQPQQLNEELLRAGSTLPQSSTTVSPNANMSESGSGVEPPTPGRPFGPETMSLPYEPPVRQHTSDPCRPQVPMPVLDYTSAMNEVPSAPLPRAPQSAIASGSVIEAQRTYHETASGPDDAAAVQLAARQSSNRSSGKRRPRTRLATQASNDTHTELEQDLSTAEDVTPTEPTQVASEVEHNLADKHSEETLGALRDLNPTWLQIIYMAFKATNSMTMIVKDVYKWIEANHAPKCSKERDWKARVRLTLSKGAITEDCGRSGWRLKESAAGMLQNHGQTRRRTVRKRLTVAKPSLVEAPIIPDSDEEQPVVPTVSREPKRPPSRHVSFSPVVTITTSIPKLRRGTRRRLPPRQHGSRPVQEQPLRSEIGDSDDEQVDLLLSDEDVQKEQTASGSRRVTRSSAAAQPAISSDNVTGVFEAHAPLLRSKGGTKNAEIASDPPAPTQPSSSPALINLKAPSSVYRTPKLPGMPRIAHFKSYSTSRRRKVSFINHRDRTPASNATKRVVETPVRDLQDPEEDELA